MLENQPLFTPSKLTKGVARALALTTCIAVGFSANAQEQEAEESNSLLENTSETGFAGIIPRSTHKSYFYLSKPNIIGAFSNNIVRR